MDNAKRPGGRARQWHFAVIGTLAATDEASARRVLRALLRLLDDSGLVSGCGGHAFPPIGGGDA